MLVHGFYYTERKNKLRKKERNCHTEHITHRCMLMDRNVNTERILNGFYVFWWVESGIVLLPNLFFIFFKYLLGVFHIYFFEILFADK